MLSLITKRNNVIPFNIVLPTWLIVLFDLKQKSERHNEIKF